MKETYTVEIDADTIEALRRTRPEYVDDLTACVNAILKEHSNGEPEVLREEVRVLLAVMRMDFRVMLRAHHSVAATLDEDPESIRTEKGRQYLSLLRRSTERALEYAMGWADFSGTLLRHIVRETVDLTAVAAEIIDALKQEAPTRLVSVRIAPGLKANADPTLARRLMDALVRNAWKFTSESDNAEIAVFRAEPDFVIEDNGIGFPQADKEAIFHPATHLHPPARFPGAGFGLAVARRIVERHGGTIHAEGMPGKGGSFFVQLRYRGIASNVRPIPLLSTIEVVSGDETDPCTARGLTSGANGSLA